MCFSGIGWTKISINHTATSAIGRYILHEGSLFHVDKYEKAYVYEYKHWKERLFFAKNIELVKPAGLELKDRLVGVQRVTKVTKGGRAFGFSAIVVVGNEDGVVGQGLGKSKEVSEAIAKAVEDAKKNLVRIPIISGTLPHEQKGKFGGAKVFLKPASEGTGVIAGGAVRAVLEAVGVQNVLSKSQGSSNPHNVVKATFDALLKLRSPITIAKQRGISLEKVFNG